MSRTRVVHLTWDLGVGGTQRCVTTLALRGNRDRFDQRVIALSHGGLSGDELSKAGVPMAILGWRSGIDPAGRLRLARLLRAWAPALVIDHGAPPLVRLTLLLLGLRRFAVFEHGDTRLRLRAPHRRWTQRAHRLDYGLAQVAVANSKMTANLIQHAYRLRADRIVVIYPGVDVDAFQPRLTPSSPEAPLAIGYLGRIDHSVKGTDRIPAIANRLAVKGLPFTWAIFGDGPDRAELEAAVAELGLADRFQWYHPAPRDVPEALARLDVLVVPSRAEGFGLTAVEALAAGTPVVASRVDGLAEALEPCPDASLVDGDSSEEFASAIMEVASPQGARRALSGPEYVRERFSQHLMLAQMEVVYDRLSR